MACTTTFNTKLKLYKWDPLKAKNATKKTENSRLGFIESVHQRT